MKTSTLLTMVTLSASCFAAPEHTAGDNPSRHIDLSAYAAPVAPAAPEIAAGAAPGPSQWRHIALPKSRKLDQSFVRQDLQPQT